jgi:hypothetical protein
MTCETRYRENAERSAAGLPPDHVRRLVVEHPAGDGTIIDMVRSWLTNLQINPVAAAIFLLVLAQPLLARALYQMPSPVTSVLSRWTRSPSSVRRTAPASSLKNRTRFA